MQGLPREGDHCYYSVAFITCDDLISRLELISTKFVYQVKQSLRCPTKIHPQSNLGFYKYGYLDYLQISVTGWEDVSKWERMPSGEANMVQYKHAKNGLCHLPEADYRDDFEWFVYCMLK